MNQGWISLHRSMLDHHFWHGEKFTKGQAWIDLILNANHKENKVMIKGRLITVSRGEQIRSQVTLAKTWKWNPRTVNKFLELLKSDGMITTKSTELTTHITICNYNTFQDKDKNSAEHNTQHTTEQGAEGVQSRVQTNNNANNVNNVNNDNKKPKAKKTPPAKIEKPDNIEEEVWQDWLTLRKTKKAPVTNTVIKGAIKQAEIAEVSLNEFLQIWCRRGSQGLEASWIKPDEKLKPADKHGGFGKKDYQAGAVIPDWATQEN